LISKRCVGVSIRQDPVSKTVSRSENGVFVVALGKPIKNSRKTSIDIPVKQILKLLPT
jgi:hypothetical protein